MPIHCWRRSISLSPSEARLGPVGSPPDRLPQVGELLVKSVILHHELGYVVAVAPSTHRVELDTLQGLLNQRLGLATENEIAELFDDCEIGAIPPVGAAYGLAVIIDESVAHLADVYFEGGDHATLVRVTGGAFRRLMKDAHPFRFSRHA